MLFVDLAVQQAEISCETQSQRSMNLNLLEEMALRLEYTLVHNSFKQLASASATSSGEKLPNQIDNLMSDSF